MMPVLSLPSLRSTTISQEKLSSFLFPQRSSIRFVLEYRMIHPSDSLTPTFIAPTSSCLPGPKARFACVRSLTGINQAGIRLTGSIAKPPSPPIQAAAENQIRSPASSILQATTALAVGAFTRILVSIYEGCACGRAINCR